MLPTDSIELVIARAYREGREKYGELGLELTVFADKVHSIVGKYLGSAPSPGAVLAFVIDMHGADLYLATACAQNSPGSSDSATCNSCDPSIAWRRLEATYKGFICDVVRFMCRSSYATVDLAESVLTDLFLPDRSGSSRIASYDARSSLSTWLRVVVCNRVINAQRSPLSKTTEIPDLPDRLALSSIDANVRALRYGPALEDSMASACSSLAPRERLMLLWRYEDGLQLGQIARLLGIHQSNVTRQLERLQSKLRDEVEAVLAAKHGLSRRAIRECLEDVVENPHHQISILEFVKNKPDSRRGTAGRSSGLVSHTATRSKLA